ncbi:hypothetical protein THAOC_27318 [Thalassiosira oceanica]|uniref:Uncharacterized protein n=1 Tax=Thalassiosira oceanica TaxID=159749 RepID=K0RLW3_THAOC|nr:hypothetical protein THAOC_27318 [Thalassiosira oceanica]|eukprot:EJK53274.1 hypothetical protein THAOC_27318 [Thalassiosira oceanica]
MISQGKFEGTPDDHLKWERMYTAGESQTTQPSYYDTSEQVYDDGAAASPSSDVRVITFDLDNTLWKTGVTITDANDCLASYLEANFGVTTRSEKYMGEMFKSNPNRYAGVDFEFEDVSSEDLVQNVGQSRISVPMIEASDGVNINASFDNDQGPRVKKSPVYLTLLRKDAIRKLIQESSYAISQADLDDQVEKAFNVWMDGRVASISSNLVPFLLPTLKHIQEQLGNQLGGRSKVYIGAITDGNSMPENVPELRGLFDFVIRAEDVGVAKPDQRVFNAAVAALMAKLAEDGLSAEEFFLGEQFEDGMSDENFVDPSATVPTWNDVDHEAVRAFAASVGPWWVHVGDDFFKDVVAAKECQMRTVWMRELIKDNSKASVGDRPTDQGKRTLVDLVSDISKSDDGVLKMTIGESEYLQSSLHDEFADAVLNHFGELGGLLSDWHNDAFGQGITR